MMQFKISVALYLDATLSNVGVSSITSGGCNNSDSWLLVIVIVCDNRQCDETGWPTDADARNSNIRYRQPK